MRPSGWYSRPRSRPGPGSEGRSMDVPAPLLPDALRRAPAALGTDESRDRKAALEDGAKRRRDLAVAAVEDHARQLGVAVISTPLGLGLAPPKGGEGLGKDEFKRPSGHRQ